MAALAIAIVGKQNEPLYLRGFEDSQAFNEISDEELFGLDSANSSTTEAPSSESGECSSRQQFLLHAALDRVEQLAGPPPGIGWRKHDTKPGRDAMFVGLLGPVEDVRLYGKSGYYASTNKCLIT